MLVARAPGLRDLDLRTINDMSPLGLQCLAKLTALTRLCILISPRLSDMHLSRCIQAGGRCLRRLELRGCINVGDASAIITARLPALTDIIFDDCERVTALGIIELVENAPALQGVAIHCCGLTASDMAECRRCAVPAGKGVNIVSGPGSVKEEDINGPF